MSAITTHVLDTALGLHEGTVAAKAMIVPRVD